MGCCSVNKGSAPIPGSPPSAAISPRSYVARRATGPASVSQRETEEKEEKKGTRDDDDDDEDCDTFREKNFTIVNNLLPFGIGLALTVDLVQGLRNRRG